MASRQFVSQHGMSSQTGAVRHMISTAVGNRVVGATAAPKKKKGTSHYIKAHKTKKGITVRGHYAKQGTSKKTGRTGAHFKKGSLAAKRHMSKLRKLRGKK
jgi:hypothetical protein